MAKILSLSEQIKLLANEVIEEQRMQQPKQVKVGYLIVEPMIAPNVAGRCIKCNKQLQLFSGCEYLIEISGDVWQNLDLKTKKILLQHELMHIDVKQNKKGELVCKIRDHDIQDFITIIEKYGVNWIKVINLLYEQLQDKKNEQKGRLKVKDKVKK